MFDPKMTRRTFAATIGAGTLAALAGCGGSAPADGSAASNDAGGEAYTIGLIQLLEHPALDAATEGFQDAVKEALGEENVTFDFTDFLCCFDFHFTDFYSDLSIS